ncbi:MAG: T9SS type A sorting domain-containing protein [Psychroserpens sp.]|uniref:T9SS type A sorting domain-containing protein n=1 Tax=Psychroserpens sp. TaxID=2020870 RepID=UPI003C779C21
MKKNYTKTTLFLILTLTMSAMSFAQIIADGTYKIFNGVNAEVMSINTIAPGDAGNPNNLIIGRAIMAVPDAMDDLQLWDFTHQGADIYKIENVGDNTVLGIKDGWCGQFGDVQVGFDDSSPYVLFKVSAADAAGTYVFEIAFDGDCNFGSTNTPIKTFDVDGGNSGAKIQTFDISTGNPNQQFEIVTPSSLGLASQASLSYELIYNSDLRTVKWDTEEVINSINVFDVSGKLIKAVTNLNSETSEIDVTGMPNGLYFFKVESNSNTISKKVLIF